MLENDPCPHCKAGILTYVPADIPWHLAYLICERCDSTYNLENVLD